MVKILKNIAIFFVALIFLSASTGVFLNFHHCELTGKTEVLTSIPDPVGCCSSHEESQNICGCGDNDCDYCYFTEENYVNNCQSDASTNEGRGSKPGHGDRNSEDHDNDEDSAPFKGDQIEVNGCCSDTPFYVNISDVFLKNSNNIEAGKHSQLIYISETNQLFSDILFPYFSERNDPSLHPPPFAYQGKHIVYLNRQLLL